MSEPGPGTTEGEASVLRRMLLPLADGDLEEENGAPVMVAWGVDALAARLAGELIKHGYMIVPAVASAPPSSTDPGDGPVEWPRGSLLERRAIFVYEVARLQAAAVAAPVVPEPWGERDEAFRSQFLDVVRMMCGPDRKASPEDLHDDWMRAYEAMGWTHGEVRDPVAKTHPDMVPFDQLGWRERIKDAVFVALCEIARQWIVDEDPGDGPDDGLHEWQCPSCGAMTRARMADHPDFGDGGAAGRLAEYLRARDVLGSHQVALDATAYGHRGEREFVADLRAVLSRLDALTAENERLRAEDAEYEAYVGRLEANIEAMCACEMDHPGDVCVVHYPAKARLERALRDAEARLNAVCRLCDEAEADPALSGPHGAIVGTTKLRAVLSASGGSGGEERAVVPLAVLRGVLDHLEDLDRQGRQYGDGSVTLAGSYAEELRATVLALARPAGGAG